MEAIKQWHLTVGTEMASRRTQVFRLSSGYSATIVKNFWPRSEMARRIIYSTFPGCNPPLQTRRCITYVHWSKSYDCAFIQILCLLDTRQAVTFYTIWKYVPITSSAALVVLWFEFNLWICERRPSLSPADKGQAELWEYLTWFAQSKVEAYLTGGNVVWPAISFL